MSGLFNRLIYPKSDRGRRRYVKDNLNPDIRTWPCYLAIVIGIAGMIVSFVICLHDRGSFAFALISMILIVFAIFCLRERRQQ